MPQPMLKRNKLRPPQLLAHCLARQKLLQRLNNAAQRGALLSLLRAPLGYGKSTLLAQYVTGIDSPWGWCRLDSADNQPLNLLLHLHAALGLQQPAQSPDAMNADRLWSAMLDHLESLDTRFTLILDDLHLLRARPAWRYLEELLHYPPANLHLLAASNGEPTLPLRHLRRDGRLHVLETRDLALDSGEIRELTAARGLAMDSDLIYLLRAGSEGWISGVLFGLDAHPGPDLPDALQPNVLSVMARQTFEQAAGFFNEEVLRQLSPALLRFLTRISVVSAFDPDLAASLSGEATAAQLIRQLQRQDLFIQQRTSDRLVYRLHPLLRRTLYQSLRQHNPERLISLHQQAADWLLAHHHYTEAVYQLGRARAFNRLLAVIERHSFDLLREGEVNSIVDFLADVPGENAADNFTLAVTEASTVIVTNDITRAGACLRRLQRLVRRNEVPERRPERVHQTLAFLRSRLAALGGNFGHSLALVERALSRYPQANAATAVLQFNRATCLFALGQLRSAREDATQSLAELEALGFSGYTNMLQLLLGQIELAQGQIVQAEERFLAHGRLQPDSAERNFYDLFQYLGLGQALLAQNRLEQAAQCFSRAEALALSVPHCAGLPWVLHYQACRHAAQGELDHARARWDEARRLARQFHLFALYRLAGAWRVRLAVRERDEDYVLTWLGELHWCQRHDSVELQPEEWIAYAWVQRHLGQHMAARQIAATLHEQAETEGNHQLRLDLHLLDAALCQDQGDLAGALGSLEHALQLAAEHGFGQLTHYEGSEMGELFRQLVNPQVRRQYNLEQPLPSRDRLLQILRGVVPSAHGDTLQLLEPLTRRELDVLLRMARGQGNQQIAQGLFISLSTVKTHINNLFRKLDANDREAALQAARRLKLLTP